VHLRNHYTIQKIKDSFIYC